MSWEGYYQAICANGHRFDYDDYMGYDGSHTCDCGAEAIFSNSVDQTNGPSQGEIIDWNVFLISPEVTNTCECCGNVKIVEKAKYRIPTEEELKKYRVYYDEEDFNTETYEYRRLSQEEYYNWIVSSD